MSKKVAHLYRIPLLISIVLGLVLTSLRVERNVLNIFLIFSGSILGTFSLDLDYIIYAYFVDPISEFSKMVISYIKHRDIGGALAYIHFHQDEVKERTLNSGLFQVILIGLTLFVLFSSTSLFFKALIISTLVNSTYRFAEYYTQGKASEWFWSLKIDTSKGTMNIYIILILVSIIYAISIF